MFILLAAYPAWIAFQVWEQSRDDELPAGGADAIVVLGAAQYDGAPSPIFRARLDQAAFLYKEQFSARVIVTGGKRPGDRFTEAESGEHYLEDQGIPEDVVFSEKEGRTTWQSLQGVGKIAADGDIKSLLLVTDPMHSERVKRMANDLGFEAVSTSPASYERLQRSRGTKLRELMHEVGSILVFEFFNR
jgi:uncharacterized SAM-binding protein YcdF (DUF218 family)